MTEVTSGCRRAAGRRPARMTAGGEGLDGLGVSPTDGTIVRGNGARDADKSGMRPGARRMIRDPQRWRKLRVISLASLATLLLVSVALLGFGVRQLVHLGRPATYRLNMLVDTEPNR